MGIQRMGHSTAAAYAFVLLTIAAQLVSAQTASRATGGRGPTSRGAASGGGATAMFRGDALTLEYPKAWTRLEPTPTPTIRLMLYPGVTQNVPGNIAEHFALIVASRKEQTTLKAFGDQILEQDRSSYRAVTVLEDNPATVGDLPARRVVVDLERDGVKLRRMYNFVIRDEVSHTFMYGGDPGEFDNWKADIQKMIASTKWTGGATSRPAGATTTRPAARRGS